MAPSMRRGPPAGTCVIVRRERITAAVGRVELALGGRRARHGADNEHRRGEQSPASDRSVLAGCRRVHVGDGEPTLRKAPRSTAKGRSSARPRQSESLETAARASGQLDRGGT